MDYTNQSNTVSVKSSKPALDPVVNTDWLERHNSQDSIVVVDIRDSADYKAGHIPHAVNIPFTSLAIEKNGLDLELPEEEDLFRLIGAAGISGDSAIVVVNNADSSYALADTTRSAATLLYAGITNVAVLNGGYDKWMKENRSTTAEEDNYKQTVYRGNLNRQIFVTRDYVVKNMGKSMIVDNRTPDVYFGVFLEPSAKRAGHIPGARCLPAPWIFTDEGTYKDTAELKEMASGVLGGDKEKEIILYCGVGGYASAWWFVLVKMLGYKNVKIYDGAAQEWTGITELPMAHYIWE